MSVGVILWKTSKTILIKQQDKHIVRNYGSRIGAGQTEVEVGQNEVSSCSIGLGQVRAS